MAVPSASKSESGPADSVTRVVTALSVPLPVASDFEVRDIAHVERMIGVGIGVAGRPWIEVAAGGGEIRLALADRVQVDAVQARLQPARRDGDVDDDAGAGLALDELRLAGDPRSFNLCLSAGASLALRDCDCTGERESPRRRPHVSLRHTSSSFEL